MDPLVMEMGLLDSGMSLSDAHALVWERPKAHLDAYLKLQEEKRLVEVTKTQQENARGA